MGEDNNPVTQLEETGTNPETTEGGGNESQTQVNPNPAYGTLVLDTVGPKGSLVIGTGAARINARTVQLHITSEAADVVQYKIYGDVDPSVDPAIQVAEADSSWLSWERGTDAENPNLVQDKLITVSASDGQKKIYVKLKDDVSNVGDAFFGLVFFDETVPTVTLVSGPTPKKISKIPEKNISTLEFQVSEPYVEYKVTVVSAEGDRQEVSTVIPTTNGSTNTSGTINAGSPYAADTPQTVTINGADLELASPGDGTKIIKVFVKDVAGNWSL